MADDIDRSEAATPYKLNKAREQGQVAKSNDVISAIGFIAAIVYISWHGWDAVKQQFYFDHALLTQAGRVTLDATMFWDLVYHMLSSSIALLGPLFTLLIFVAIASNIIQTGPIFSFDPIKPEWERLNPLSGFKRLFSIKTLFDAGKLCIKMGLLALVVYYVVKDMLHRQFFAIAGLSPAGFIQAVINDCVSLGLKMAMIMALVAIIDFVFTRRQFSRRMRMSKRDIKEENKQRNGHPRIRARLRKLRKELHKRSQSVRNTGKADVVITNPTHVAVALRYVHGEMESPQLIAKGAGVLAAVIRKIAARHHIPVVQNRALARRIFHEMETEQHVPQNLYRDVARIIVWVFAMKKARAANLQPSLPVTETTSGQVTP